MRVRVAPKTVGSKARRRRRTDGRKEGWKLNAKTGRESEGRESRRTESWAEERKDGALSKEMEKERWGTARRDESKGRGKRGMERRLQGSIMWYKVARVRGDEGGRRGMHPRWLSRHLQRAVNTCAGGNALIGSQMGSSASYLQAQTLTSSFSFSSSSSFSPASIFSVSFFDIRNSQSTRAQSTAVDDYPTSVTSVSSG